MPRQYRIFISGSAPVLYPVDTFFGLLYYSRDEAMEIPKRYPYSGEWGRPLGQHLMEREQYPMPGLLDLVWLSVTERKFYSIMKRIPDERMAAMFEQQDDVSGEPLFDSLVVGMAPYGGLALWIHGEKKSEQVMWTHALETTVEMKDFMPMNPEVTLDENCNFYINQDSRVRENLEQNGLPPRDLYDNYMKQYTYRYVPMFEVWDEAKGDWRKYNEEEEKKGLPELDYIEEALFDGTHDKLHDGRLMKYHEAGKPKKLALKWHIKKSEWSAYLWFEDEETVSVFHRFYGTHANTKTDFMLRIDPWHDHYELALYRSGLHQPQVIPQRAYQMLVFRNDFECYRSENYSQARGAWIW